MSPRNGFIRAWLALVLLIGCSAHDALLGPPWEAVVEQDHVLVGRIWNTTEHRFLTPQALVQDVAASRFLILGEKHDNPDQHRIQAWIIGELVSETRRPAVAFEMFSPDQLPALRDHLASHPRDAVGLARAVGWKTSGWPNFALYRPVVEAALQADLKIYPANLSRVELVALRDGDFDALEESFVRRFGLDQPLSTERYAILAEDIRESHCGYVSGAAIPPMIEVQRGRDARMAQSLLDGAQPDGVVLIAGAGHARRDGGVPTYLVLEEPEAKISSVALMEVESGANEPVDYLDGMRTSAFDYLWFTPRVDDVDPCEKFREQLEKLDTREPTR